ncbi:MAG: tRNA (cytidine(34)-2'-O)-methyltransferase [Mycoplasma sp.]|nr:tRNA (cytidine(34)-2'-O)-methyltransferase [Mycoplasma sp.]
MIHIILYQPEISPNTGNIIRTCSATGAKLHIIRPISFELRPKFLKRPAAGRLLSEIEHEVHNSYEEFEEKYGKKTIYYVTRYGQQYHSDPDYSKHKEDIFLMFGRESTGIPKEIMKNKINMCIRIPMTSHERSLNLANTVMLISYEVLRQKKYEGLSKFEVQKGKDWLLK